MKPEDTGKVQDRRRHQRKPLQAKIKYAILMPYSAIGSTIDISDGGLCLLVDRELQKGFILKVEMESPHSVESHLVKVMWQQKRGEKFLTGVKFLT